MFSNYEAEYYLFIVILGVGLYYLYKAVEQIRKKDFEFYRKEIYTRQSVEKWAVRDGILKAAAAVTLCIYAGFGLAGIKLTWLVMILLALILGLYFYLYPKTLVKKDAE